MIQGSWYSYGDGKSGCTPATGNPCTSGSCCMMGATIVDTTYAAWGCGIGMELSSSGGTAPTKSVYAGPAKCFNITLTGNSGGNPVRIGFSQSPTPAANAVAPYKEIPAFTSGWTGQVCFADVTCPSFAVTARDVHQGRGRRHARRHAAPDPRRRSRGRVQRLHQQDRAGRQRRHRHGRLGRRHDELRERRAARARSRTQYGDAHVMCPKDYIVQNNAWGSTAGQTITFGPGTKMKVTVQNETRTNNSTPAGYPSIFTGAYNGRSTTGSGLPRAISSIPAGSVQTSLHLGRPTARPAATTPPTTSGSAPARAATRRRRRPAAAS